MQEPINRINEALTKSGYAQLDSEQLACIHDKARKIEAVEMLDDIHARILNAPCAAIDDLKGMLYAPRSAYRGTMTPAQFIAAAVDVSKEEILERVSMGEIPERVAGFSELHEFMDANCIGGFCDEDLHPVFDAIFPHTASDDGEIISSGAFMDAVATVQDTIHNWLTTGGFDADLAAAKEASAD